MKPQLQTFTMGRIGNTHLASALDRYLKTGSGADRAEAMRLLSKARDAKSEERKAKGEER